MSLRHRRRLLALFLPALFAGGAVAAVGACGSSSSSPDGTSGEAGRSAPADSGATGTGDGGSAGTGDGASADGADGAVIDAGPCPVFNTTLPTLAWTPRSDWVQVTGAKGDGVTDDTAALQAALAKADDTATGPKTVFIPAGTFRITQTLTAKGIQGFQLIGTGETTRIVWDGPTVDAGAPGAGSGTSGVMFLSNGLSRALFQGIVWDGQGKAAVGVDHDSSSYYETFMRHYDERFVGFTVAGVRTEDNVIPSAEIFFRNEVFENCAAGILLSAPNDYDNKILGCAFVDDAVGIDSVAGNFNVSASNFVGSTVDDVRINNHSFRMTSVVSRCSAQVVHSDVTENATQLMVADSRIRDWTSDAGALYLGAAGPFTLIDDVFTGGNGTPVRMTYSSGGNDAATAPQPVLTSGCVADGPDGSTAVVDLGKSASLVDVPVGAGPTSTLTDDTWFQSTTPTLPVPPQIFDVTKYGFTTGSNADATPAIQAAIDAAREAGGGAMAYLPPGGYGLHSPLDVHGSSYVISGGGVRTVLYWDGNADGGTGSVMMSVVDPDHVTIENLSFQPAAADQSAVAAIQQTSAGAATSSVIYEGIAVPQSQSDNGVPTTEVARSLELVSLGSGATVHVTSLLGTMNAIECSAATIFVDVWESGVTHLSGPSSPRTGFFGVDARYNAGNDFDYILEDNTSITVGHSYTEQTSRALHASGSAGAATPGQIVIGMAKFEFNDDNIVQMDNYDGLVALGEGFVQVTPADAPDSGFHFVQTGTASTSLLFWGGSFWYPPVLDLTPSGSSLSLQSHVYRNGLPVAVPLPNTAGAAAITATSATFDALRRLRATQLTLDFGR